MSIAESIPEHLRELVLGVLERRGLVREIKGELYGAVPEWGPDGKHIGWHVYRLEYAAPEYFVAADYSSCTCEGWGRFQSCKHIDSLKYGV